MNSSLWRTSSFREWRRKQAYNVLPLFPPVASFLIRGFGATLKVRFTGHLPVLDKVKSGDPFLLAFFHGRQFLLVQHLTGWPVAIMTSISYMGEIQSRILKSFGYATIKGSRTRGGARVLAEMIALVRQGRIGAFAVDGPRGPHREVKPGAVFVAKKLGVPVVPVSTSAWPSVVLDSVWDRYLLPMPFSRAVVHFGEPVFFDGDLSEGSIEQDCKRIGRLLEDLEAEADALTGRTGK
jgi:lysophospholipid acyltransferase (LPLAT)-like uncharacterized protein